MAAMRHLILLSLALAATGCGYTPPPSTDTSSASYKTDLAACDTSVEQAVVGQAAKRGYTWAASGVTRWSKIDDGMRSCMSGKGWGQIRTCTAEELRQGNSTKGLVV